MQVTRPWRLRPPRGCGSTAHPRILVAAARVSASDVAAAAATEAAEAAMAQAKELSMAMGVLAAENQDLKEQVIFERRRAEAAEAALQQQQRTTAEAAEAAQISLSQYCERRGAAEAAKVRAAPRDPPRSWR